MKKITILIPCYNEELSLPALYASLKDEVMKDVTYEWELLFVDDGSKDNTLGVLEQLRTEDKRINYVELSRNFGKEKAMLAGFDYATGDCMVIMDADLQHPPHVVPEMIKKWEEGFDDVYGKRISRGKESWLRKKLSLLFYKLLQASVRYDILPNVGDFRLLDRKCIDALKQIRENERYTKGMYCFIGFKKTYVEFETQERFAGDSSWSYISLLKLAIEGIVSFTNAPLRVSTIAGIIVSMLAFFYLVYVIVKTTLFGDPVSGFPTIVSLVLFIGGIQLLSLGIIGEYLGRVFIETKNRPTYFVRRFNGER